MQYLVLRHLDSKSRRAILLRSINAFIPVRSSIILSVSLSSWVSSLMTVTRLQLVLSSDVSTLHLQMSLMLNAVSFWYIPLSPITENMHSHMKLFFLHWLRSQTSDPRELWLDHFPDFAFQPDPFPDPKHFWSNQFYTQNTFYPRNLCSALQLIVGSNKIVRL